MQSEQVRTGASHPATDQPSVQVQRSSATALSRTAEQVQIWGTHRLLLSPVTWLHISFLLRKQGGLVVTSLVLFHLFLIHEKYGLASTPVLKSEYHWLK